jgi:hypothetical protein
MNWKVTVDVQGLQRKPNPTKPLPMPKPPVIFNFEEEPGMYILFAKGGKVYENNVISYHDWREYLEIRLEVKPYFRSWKNGVGRLVTLKTDMLIIIIIHLFIINFV